MWTTLVLSDVMILERDWILHEQLTYEKGTGGMSKKMGWSAVWCCLLDVYSYYLHKLISYHGV